MNDSEAIYDISSIPYFAYSPGLVEWSILLAFLVLVYLTAIFVGRKRRKALSQSAALGAAIIELKNISDSKLALKERYFRASLIGRRLLSTLTGLDLAQSSLAELKQYIDSTQSPKLKAVLGSIYTLDSEKFKPDSDAWSREALSALVSALTEYNSELEPK